MELITIEQHLMTFISLIWILTNGESQKQKEILHNLEEAILQAYLLIRTKCLLLEDGTLFCSFQICLFIILRLKLGSSRRCYTKFPNGILVDAWLPQFLPGNILFLVEVVEHFLKAATVLEANIEMTAGIMISIIKSGFV